MWIGAVLYRPNPEENKACEIVPASLCEITILIHPVELIRLDPFLKIGWGILEILSAG
jgi:hypothetical protein